MPALPETEASGRVKKREKDRRSANDGATHCCHPRKHVTPSKAPFKGAGLSGFARKSFPASPQACYVSSGYCVPRDARAGEAARPENGRLEERGQPPCR